MGMSEQPLLFPELKGCKVMLCDVIYQTPSPATNWKDYINFVYRDLITKKKHLYVIENPRIIIYEVPEELRGEFQTPRHFMELDRLIPHQVK